MRNKGWVEASWTIRQHQGGSARQRGSPGIRGLSEELHVTQDESGLSNLAWLVPVWKVWLECNVGIDTSAHLGKSAQLQSLYLETYHVFSRQSHEYDPNQLSTGQSNCLLDTYPPPYHLLKRFLSATCN